MNKLEALRNDLRVDFSKIEPIPGSIVIICPRLTELAFTPQYSQWLSENMRNILPDDVHLVILAEPLSINQAGKPAEGGEDYMRGWEDCLRSLVAVDALEDKHE